MNWNFDEHTKNGDCETRRFTERESEIETIMLRVRGLGERYGYCVKCQCLTFLESVCEKVGKSDFLSEGRCLDVPMQIPYFPKPDLFSKHLVIRYVQKTIIFILLYTHG